MFNSFVLMPLENAIMNMDFDVQFCKLKQKVGRFLIVAGVANLVGLLLVPCMYKHTPKQKLMWLSNGGRTEERFLCELYLICFKWTLWKCYMPCKCLFIPFMYRRIIVGSLFLSCFKVKSFVVFYFIFEFLLCTPGSEACEQTVSDVIDLKIYNLVQKLLAQPTPLFIVTILRQQFWQFIYSFQTEFNVHGLKN